MDSLSCMKSRVYNVVELPGKYDNPHGLRQLRAAIRVVPLFCRALLQDQGEAGVRTVLAIYQAINKFTRGRYAKKLWKSHGTRGAILMKIWGPLLVKTDIQSPHWCFFNISMGRCPRPRRVRPLGGGTTPRASSPLHSGHEGSSCFRPSGPRSANRCPGVVPLDSQAQGPKVESNHPWSASPSWRSPEAASSTTTAASFTRARAARGLSTCPRHVQSPTTSSRTGFAPQLHSRSGAALRSPSAGPAHRP